MMKKNKSRIAKSMMFLSVACVALFLFSCAPRIDYSSKIKEDQPTSGILSGRFTYRGSPVIEGGIFLSEQYPPPKELKVFTTRTDQNGYFDISVPAGRYYIYGKGKGETDIFAYSGQNPIDLGRKKRFVGLKGTSVSKPVYESSDDEGGSLKGKVLFEGEAIENGYVYLYSDDSSLFKGLGFAVSPPTDVEGNFYLENLIETDYVIIARKRESGAMTGPLNLGDLYCFYPSNPVQIHEGKIASIVLECVRKEKEISYAEVTSGSPISVSGFVVDRFGNPVEGVYAFVYDTRVFGHRRPYSHSGKTGADGRFTINIDKPGTYYLGTREIFGKTPRPGELIGFYDATPDHSIRVNGGERISDIVLVVGRILESDEKETGEPVLQERIYDRGMPIRAISEDTTMRGKVVVEGIVVVPKGITVTLLPGTMVMFKKIDIDGDGIGDGEFYVEGNIFVRGTRENPVIFTSAEANPSPKDWKYFFVNLSSESYFEHLISEYAFSGLQIHFSNAVVRNCLFRNNVDGLRFSTVRGVFEDNLMKGNTYGVRYEERASDAVLRRNLITENKVGIFSVLESKGGLKIKENNVENNRSYNFKLGNRQIYDLPVQENWWGSTRKEEIEETIFDGIDVSGLGRVLYQPFSKEPFEAGPK